MLRAFSSVMVVVVGLSASVVRVDAEIYNLGTLGGNASGAEAINDLNQVVGSSVVPGNGLSRGFLYTGPLGSSSMLDLGVLSGNLGSLAYSINNSGQIAGIASAVIAGEQTERPFLYTGTPGAGGAMVDLGTHGGLYGAAFSINTNSAISGYSWRLEPTFGDHAFVYSGTPGSGGSMIDLGTFGGSVSIGRAINDGGAVVGQSTTTGNAAGLPFVYTPGAGLVSLGTLGGQHGDARAINNAGIIVGSAFTSSGPSHAFRYQGTPGNGGSMQDLGTLGGTTSVAFGINEAGAIVGESQTAAGETRPFLYVGTPGADGQMIDLESWLNLVNPIDGSHWTLETAKDINNNGLVVGTGMYNDGDGVGLEDGRRAFVLDVTSLIPEPASMSAFAACAVLVLGRRRS